MDYELLAYALELDKDQNDDPKIDPNKCKYCYGIEFIYEDYGRICESCHVIDKLYRRLVPENLLNYTIHSKNTYTPASYFKKCIERYLGLQTCNIPDSIYDALKDTEITRSTILKCLKELKYVKHYKNVHKIYFDLAGQMIDDIGYLEHTLVQDYREFTRVYNTLDIDRKNFLNAQYMLYRLLERRRHVCNLENFNLPKTQMSRTFHDKVCKRVFETLGWDFPNL